MADVLNRSTKQYLASVNTPEYPVQDWIVNPNMTAVIGLPAKYWKITGDVVSAMTQGEKDAVDGVNSGAARDALSAKLDNVEDILRAFALVVLDELNAHSTRINAVLTAIDNGATLANIKTSVLAITDIPTRNIAQIKTALRSKLGS